MWKNKLNKVSDDDKQRILLLRQQVHLNEDQYRARLISRAEYEKTCDRIMEELVTLEEKYGA